MIHDVTFAIRYLRRRPALTLVAAGTIALGLGAVTAMFSVVDAVLLRDLPFREPQQLVSLWHTFPHWRGEKGGLDTQWDRIMFDWCDYETLKRDSRTLDGVSAAYYRKGRVRRRAEAGVEELWVARASASMLPMLGARTQLGRWFLPEEEGSAAPTLAVISHSYWQSALGGDPAVLGQAVEVDGEVFTIAGVLPATFRLPGVGPFAGRMNARLSGCRPAGQRANSARTRTTTSSRQGCVPASPRPRRWTKCDAS